MRMKAILSLIVLILHHILYNETNAFVDETIIGNWN